MKAQILDWFGFGENGHAAHGHTHDAGDHGHTHGVVDPSIVTTAKGIWAIKWSFVILAATSVLQFVVVLMSGSVALLADMIHNLGDATTAIPLWVAFLLARRPPTKVFNYGLGRVEDIAGIFIVLIILVSALIAGYEAIDRLLHPQAISQLGWVAAAGLIGFLGNEAVAIFRIRVGREMNSAALIADGYHARTDGFTSLAVLLGAFGVWLGFPLADPIIGLLITLTILGIVWQSARSVITRALDGVEPELVDEIHHVGEHISGLKIVDVRARWLGHRLYADVAVTADDALPLHEAVRLMHKLRGELMGHIRVLRSATITFATPNDTKIFEVLPHPHGHAHSTHHAPEPFVVASDMAKGVLAIVDTEKGERFRLTLTQCAAGLTASVSINRPAGNELLDLEPTAQNPLVYESTIAPAEPHEFTADLRVSAFGRQDALSFEMKEPEGHVH